MDSNEINRLLSLAQQLEKNVASFAKSAKKISLSDDINNAIDDVAKTLRAESQKLTHISKISKSQYSREIQRKMKSDDPADDEGLNSSHLRRKRIRQMHKKSSFNKKRAHFVQGGLPSLGKK